MTIEVLYEDNHLIAVRKPAGVLTQGDASGDISLMDEVKKYLKEKYKKPGNVFLGLLHRLDRPVAGIILFAKTSKGASRLSEQFRTHSVVKIYHTIVLGKLEKNRATLINYLLKDENRKVAKISENNNGGQLAELNFEVLKSNDQYSLLKIQIKTGRFHQIRAQLAHLGHPILGDIKYGAPFALPDKSIALAAVNLSFLTATGQEEINLSIPVSEDWAKYVKI